MTLPVRYNVQVAQALLPGGITVGGDPPVVLHFTDNKPFNGPVAGALGHEFLCSMAELDRRLAAGVTG
jgi:lipopolysaccharide biosynthesis glycosyltransferase